MAFEIVRRLGRVPDAVVVPFGGGGLATGVACGLAADAGEAPGALRRVWGMQSEASPAMARSLETGVAVERLESPDATLADGLEGGISARAFARAARVVAGVGVTRERAIAAAIAYGIREVGVVMEGERLRVRARPGARPRGLPRRSAAATWCSSSPGGTSIRA